MRRLQDHARIRSQSHEEGIGLLSLQNKEWLGGRVKLLESLLQPFQRFPDKRGNGDFHLLPLKALAQRRGGPRNCNDLLTFWRSATL